MNTRTTTISSERQVHDDNQRTTTPIPRQKPGTTATEGLLNSNARSSRIFASQPHYIASQKKATEGKQRAKEDQGDHLLKGREKRATSKLGDEKVTLNQLHHTDQHHHQLNTHHHATATPLLNQRQTKPHSQNPEIRTGFNPLQTVTKPLETG